MDYVEAENSTDVSALDYTNIGDESFWAGKLELFQVSL